MKWLLYILASLMLILPCVPCKAAEACCTEAAACADEQDEHGQEQNKDHQEDHSPVCPCCPFFACNSCHCIISSQDIIALPQPVVAVAAMPCTYTETSLSYYAPAVWQPPKPEWTA